MDLSKLNEKQREAVQTTEGALLVVAGAGSGKTRVLTNRIAYLIHEKNVNPWNILALTFTNKAASEMKSRIKTIVGEKSKYVWAGTFHSICSKILRVHAQELGYSSNFIIYDSSDQKSLVKSVMKGLEISEKEISPNYVLSEISMAKNCMISPDVYKKTTDFDKDRENVSKIYPLYTKELKDNNAMDFDDLILKVIELFKSKPEILEIYADKFRYIHVDEYQDTNLSQYELVQILSKKHNNICVVGDQDQSIYSWRGADIRNIKEFEKDFKNSRTILLEQNYRSTKNILNLANAVISNNDDRIEKKLWTDNESGEKISYYCAKNEEDEARYVAGIIMEGINSGRKFGDFAVMYRSNSQSRDFEQYFAINSIPYKIVGGLKFYDRKEIKDIHAFLRLVTNPNDSVAGLRVINEPRRGIGAKTTERLLRFASVNSINFMDSIKESLEQKLFKGNTFAGLKEFYDLISSAREVFKTSKPSELVKYFLEESGYLENLKQDKTPESNSRLENIDELLSLFMNNEKNDPDFSLTKYLEDISLLSDQDDIDFEQEDMVLFMTFHSAKGLEFPVVFMVGMEENIFPSYYSSGDGMYEERRLCYVGITRAIEELHLSHAEIRFRFGKHQVNRPSMFLEEMPEEYLKRISPYKREFINNDGPVSRVKNEEKLTAKEILNPNEIFVGSKIKHKMFGRGVVIRMNERNDDIELLIAFDNKGLKKLMLSKSPLEIYV